MNASFLLWDRPALREIIRRARDRGLALCGFADCNELYAFAIHTRINCAADKSVYGLLEWLTAGAGESFDPSDIQAPDEPMIVPGYASRTRSPAVAGLCGSPRRPLHDAPRYLNIALEEILFHPEDTGPVGGDHGRLGVSLIAQRNVSRVPWIFNELACEVDHRTAEIVPLSMPPEIHLATTGRCNLECRFCSYAAGQAIPAVVSPEMIRRLDYLRYVRTLRLQSGNGEPTLNPHLSTILRDLAQLQPHLEINFFTNGLLLDRHGLMETLVDTGIAWVNVSLNAATGQTWAELCAADSFEKVRRNLQDVLGLKRSRRSISPLMYGSMVLMRKNAGELPRMPALCRELGIDRFTAIPFFGLGELGPGRYGPEESYHHIGNSYNRLHDEAVREAEVHGISIELPHPVGQRDTAFGIESRILHDFARVELNERRLGQLLRAHPFEETTPTACPSLWRQAAVTCVTRGQGRAGQSHFLYPCLGPLAVVELASRTPFPFEGEECFNKLWRGPLLGLLRQAQLKKGICPACDICRTCDSRDPQIIGRLRELLATLHLDRA
jgi:pyruvate-formate lyase-activating enzyme